MYNIVIELAAYVIVVGWMVMIAR